MRVEEGVRLALESRRRAEEEADHAHIEAEEEALLIVEDLLKSEGDQQDRLRVDEEARFEEETR